MGLYCHVCLLKCDSPNQLCEIKRDMGDGTTKGPRASDDHNLLTESMPPAMNDVDNRIKVEFKETQKYSQTPKTTTLRPPNTANKSPPTTTTNFKCINGYQ